MNVMWIVAAFLTVFLGSVVASLVGDEVKGWIGRIPRAVLWLASRRVPSSHRDELYADWVADLEGELQDKSELPITRVMFGVKFAASLIRGGHRVADELGPMHRVDRRFQTGVGTRYTVKVLDDSVGLSDSAVRETFAYAEAATAHGVAGDPTVYEVGPVESGGPYKGLEPFLNRAAGQSTDLGPPPTVTPRG